MTDHPITPPPELVQQWTDEYIKDKLACAAPEFIATRAAQWGADQELEACCEWVSAISGKYGPRLRIARRPKPQSLKEQALEALNLMLMFVPPGDQREQGEAIRRALEQLDD